MGSDRIILSGFGGQGIVAAGRTLAYAGMRDGKQVSMLPSYGPEMRGGFANCQVILSDAEIASPIVSEADAVVAMSALAFEKFEIRVLPGKTLIMDSSQIRQASRREDIRVINIPATKMAMELGNVKIANMVMIGALTGALKCVSVDSLTEAIKDLLPREKVALFELEMKALHAGREWVAKGR